MAQPHPVTLSGGLVHFQTDMDGLMQITGSGNITVCGINLFDKTAATQGKYINSSGAIVNAPSGYNWSMTDYIPVSGLSKIRYRRNGTAGTAPYSAWYTADKTLISTWKQQISTKDTQINEAEVPNNATYMRMSILFGGNENFCMIVAGTDAISDYEAYTGITIPSGTPRKSLVGINNVWSDSGSVTVTYWTH